MILIHKYTVISITFFETYCLIIYKRFTLRCISHNMNVIKQYTKKSNFITPNEYNLN